MEDFAQALAQSFSEAAKSRREVHADFCDLAWRGETTHYVSSEDGLNFPVLFAAGFFGPYQ